MMTQAQRGRVTRWNVMVELFERERAGQVPQSVRELADSQYDHGSNGSMHVTLRGLRDRGLVTWQPHRCRTLRLTDAGRAFVLDVLAQAEASAPSHPSHPSEGAHIRAGAGAA